MIPIFANQKIRVNYKTTENIVIYVRGMVKLENGDIVQINEGINVTDVTSGAVTAGYFDKKIPSGELLTFTIKTPTQNIQRGQCYCRADVLFDADDFHSVSICSNYLTTNANIIIGQNYDSLSGRGFETSRACYGGAFSPNTNQIVLIKGLYVTYTTYGSVNVYPAVSKTEYQASEKYYLSPTAYTVETSNLYVTLFPNLSARHYVDGFHLITDSLTSNLFLKDTNAIYAVDLLSNAAEINMIVNYELWIAE